jgi:chromosome segregation ATPase
MRNSRSRAVMAAAVTIFCSLTGPVSAQDNVEARLRAALRTATAQLRELQDHNATLMAQQAQAERDRAALAQRVAAGEREMEALRQQIASAHAATDQAAAQAANQREAQARTDAANRETFARLQAEYNETVQMARTRDADSARFEATASQLRGRVQACEAQNAELSKLGMELVGLMGDRNAFGRPRVLEPLTGLKRVQIENMMQDYEDKVRANELARPIPP